MNSSSGFVVLAQSPKEVSTASITCRESSGGGGGTIAGNGMSAYLLL